MYKTIDDKIRNGKYSFGMHAYIKATIVLAHSQGRLRSLAGRACMGRNPRANNRNTLIEQSPRWYTKDQRL